MTLSLYSAAVFVLAASVGWCALVLVVGLLIHGRAWVGERAREAAHALAWEWRARLAALRRPLAVARARAHQR